MKRIEAGLLAMLLAGCGAATSSGTTKANIPDQQSAGAQLLISNCTECHGVPQPGSHPANEWAAVVNRMQNWRTTKGFGPMPKKDEAEIIRYLQEHARK